MPTRPARPVRRDVGRNSGPRRSAVRALLALALLLPAGAARGQAPEVDPVLQRLLQPETRDRVLAYGAIPRDTAAAQPLGGTVALDTDSEGRTRVGVLLQFRSAAVVAQLRDLGVEVGSVSRSVLTARVPLGVLPAVLVLPVERIHAARVLRLVHDSSMAAIGADRVRQRLADGAGWAGATGAGALIGIVDTGIDIRHPDFHDDTGATRIAAVWDQLGSGMPAPGSGTGCTARGSGSSS